MYETDPTFNTNCLKLPLSVMAGIDNCSKTFLIAYCYITSESAASFKFIGDQLSDLVFYKRIPSYVHGPLICTPPRLRASQTSSPNNSAKMSPIDKALRDLKSQDFPNISATAKEWGVNRSTLLRNFNGVTRPRHVADKLSKCKLSVRSTAVGEVRTIRATGYPGTQE
jgi:hypothetical protein